MSPAPARRRPDERGAAVVDFVLVSILVLALFLALLQLGFGLYIRNTVISCASEGARLGARADSSPEAGAQRARDLLTATLSPAYAQAVTARTTRTAAGVSVVVVEVRAPLPVLGPFGPAGVLDLRGRAFEERQ